jgi:cbb3-type cytochrome oxidase cytochrome c subunit
MMGMRWNHIFDPNLYNPHSINPSYPHQQQQPNQKEQSSTTTNQIKSMGNKQSKDSRMQRHGIVKKTVGTRFTTTGTGGGLSTNSGGQHSFLVSLFFF